MSLRWEVNSAPASHYHPQIEAALSLHPWARPYVDRLQTKQPDTYAHCVRAAHIVCGIYPFIPPKALLVEQSERGVYALPVAALLHDVGKLGLDPESLNKPGCLTLPEQIEMETHVRRGFEILWPHSPLTARIMVAHHEFQRRPYPRHPNPKTISYKGPERRQPVDPGILFAQQLVALADVTDALLSPRAYKPPWTEVETRRELQKKFGDYFGYNIIDRAIRIRQNLESFT